MMPQLCEKCGGSGGGTDPATKCTRCDGEGRLSASKAIWQWLDRNAADFLPDIADQRRMYQIAGLCSDVQAGALLALLSGQKSADRQTKPAVPGFYWRRYSTGERWEVCEVMPGTMHAFFAGSPRGYALSEIEGEWVGPLSQPSDQLSRRDADE